MTQLHPAVAAPTAPSTPCPLCSATDAVEIIASTLDAPRPARPTHIEPIGANAGSASAFACTSGGYGRHGPIVRCPHCDLVYADPRPNNEEALDIYATVEDPLYVAEREGRILTFEQHLEPMERFTGPGAGRTLLDVGAYTGVFVEIATGHGWDAWGVEPSAWAVGEAQKEGLKMVLGTLEDAEFQSESASVITMWDVIEHVADPLATLKAAWRILEPGGYLVVHTMDLASPFARLMGRRWPWFMEMHLTYFTRDTLRAMLEKAGFSLTWMGAQGRYLHAGYLASRVTALWPLIGRPLEWLIRQTRLTNIPLHVNLGDLFTTYARKPT
jgi:predicted SAM-dependent methyltransferase